MSTFHFDILPIFNGLANNTNIHEDKKFLLTLKLNFQK